MSLSHSRPFRSSVLQAVVLKILEMRVSRVLDAEELMQVIIRSELQISQKETCIISLSP